MDNIKSNSSQSSETIPSAKMLIDETIRETEAMQNFISKTLQLVNKTIQYHEVEIDTLKEAREILQRHARPDGQVLTRM